MRRCIIALFLATLLIAIPCIVADADSLPREGGETIEDAVEIPAMPWQDEGSTCDHVDDYDEVCPYTGSTSPDVVYRYVAPEYLNVYIDLCASLYDTKVYVYDFEDGYGFGNPLACNDDAGCGYSGYQSLLELVPFHAGHTYYIVVDGYGGACGDYTIQIAQNYQCPLECPEGSQLEGEPPLEDGYVDTYNGGCDSPPDYPFQSLCGDAAGDLVFCGRAGNYMVDDVVMRDTDWFMLFKGNDPFRATLTAEQDSRIYQVLFDPELRCEGTFPPWQGTYCPRCESITLDLEGEVGQEVWLWVAVDGWEGQPEYTYILELEGLASGHTPAQRSSWGEIKQMFR